MDGNRPSEFPDDDDDDGMAFVVPPEPEPPEPPEPEPEPEAGSAAQAITQDSAPALDVPLRRFLRGDGGVVSVSPQVGSSQTRRHRRHAPHALIS